LTLNDIGEFDKKFQSCGSAIENSLDLLQQRFGAKQSKRHDICWWIAVSTRGAIQ